MQLNPQQQAAKVNIDGPLLVLAGAGSGKTRVITEKIAYLIQVCHYLPSQIIAMTFTNKAAREMRERISKKLGVDAIEGLTITTFHSLGLKIIQSEIKYFPLKRGFTIFDDQDSTMILRELLRSKGHLDKAWLYKVKQKISSWKNLQLSPEQVLKNTLTPFEATMADCYQQYVKHCRLYNAVDFDDLIYLPVKAFSENEELTSRWQQAIRYLLVDEYQDTSSGQYAFVKSLVGDAGRFTVVGDDDQSIYAWRGAEVENLLLLKKDYPRLSIVKLEQNYRSTQLILNAANHVIANNPQNFSKKLWSDKAKGEKIRIIHCENDEQEAKQIAAEIRAHQLQTQKPFSEYAILYRSNHQARRFEQALTEQNIPYRISGSGSFLERMEVKDMLAYLRLLVNTKDDSAFLRIINVPRRGIGISSLEKIAAYAKRRDKNLLDVCSEMGLAQDITPAVYKKIQTFLSFFHKTQEKIKRITASELCAGILSAVNYKAHLQQLGFSDKDQQKRLDNIDDLAQWLDRLQTQGQSLSDALQQILLIDTMREDDAGNEVNLLTLHAAKGLEFPFVYMVGMEQGILPHQNSLDNDDIEEERRLCYVGITRAQSNLVLSLALQRKYQGKLVQNEPSVFIDELPDGDIIKTGHRQKVSKEQQPNVKNHLAGMRALLNKELSSS